MQLENCENWFHNDDLNRGSAKGQIGRMFKSHLNKAVPVQFPYCRGLKHAARGPYVARQMHMCGQQTSQKMTKLKMLINFSLFRGLCM